ncbi:MAG TPA: hypothetical protein VM536_22415 [Chloroflexia bacterium]|nr:hypothetical protein [Chloroflexia bacterium]
MSGSIPAPLTDEPIFEYHSGAQVIHPSGSWSLLLDTRGVMTLRHTVFGQQTDLGAFPLTEPEQALLWQHIRALDLAHLRPDDRMPLPDEYCSTFILRQGGMVHRMDVWAHVAQDYPPIQAWVAAIKPLIARYCGCDPII